LGSDESGEAAEDFVLSSPDGTDTLAAGSQALAGGDGGGMESMMGGAEGQAMAGGGGEAMAGGGGGGGSTCTFAEDQYTATHFIYGLNGRTVNYISQEQWCWYEGYDCPETCDECPRPNSYVVNSATEYRYDQARERYYELALDPVDFKNSILDEAANQVPSWFDFEDGEISGQFRVDGPSTITEIRAFEPGLWQRESTGAATYLHNDHLGTLRQRTNGSGAAQGLTTYTAFGEQTGGSTLAFGYAGAWGYRRDGQSTYLHLGHRYYDPGSGRFLQRDPIGIEGGPNVYAYALGLPTAFVDPNGLAIWPDSWVDGVACGFWMNIHSTKTLAEMSNGRATAEAVGAVLWAALQSA
jgi:RHS repeat-associated protein